MLMAEIQYCMLVHMVLIPFKVVLFNYVVTKTTKTKQINLYFLYSWQKYPTHQYDLEKCLISDVSRHSSQLQALKMSTL